METTHTRRIPRDVVINEEQPLNTTRTLGISTIHLMRNAAEL